MSYNRLSRKAGTLAPTSSIKDPEVRAFCDSLTNAWHLRNGSSGADDLDRFITKGEWDWLAQNPMIRSLAGIGQPGSTPGTGEPGAPGAPGAPGGPGEGGGGGFGTLPPGVTNALATIMSGITLIDFATIRKVNNELFASIYALTTQVGEHVKFLLAEIAKLENGITEINTVEETSTSANATHLWALTAKVEDPETGLPFAVAGVIALEDVSATSTSANAKQTHGVVAQVNNPATGLPAAHAGIVDINTVSATSKSANAQYLHGLHAQVNNPITGLPNAWASIASIEDVTVTSKSVNAQRTAGMYVQLNDPYGGAFALINEINTVSVTSKSLNARTLAGLQVGVGLKSKVFVQMSEPVEITNPGTTNEYKLKEGDLWIDTDNNMLMKAWKLPPNVATKGWYDASDQRLTQAMAGVTGEQQARIDSDGALASTLNSVWAFIGDGEALVQDGSTVTITNKSITADKFTQVQVAVMDPVTKQPISSAAVKQDLATKVETDNKKANATYTLQVQTQVQGGPKVIAGMSLYSNAEYGKPAETGCVFVVDTFGVWHANMLNEDGTRKNEALNPFIIMDGKVRINLLYIGDFIRSDEFYRPGQGGYPEGRGWKIDRYGNAELYGTTLMARVVSGSKLVDRNSGQDLATTAVSAWTGAASGASIHGNSALTFYGPDRHSWTDMYHRIRDTDANGRLLATTVQFMGVADDKITIWGRYAGGAWQALSFTTTPTSDYNAATCGWAGVLGCALGGWWEFGVSPTNPSMQGSDSGKNDLTNFTMTVTMSNM